MAEQKNSLRKPHNIAMNNCQKLSLTGITDVGGFDDRVVRCYTDMGELIIKGTNLHIDRVDVSIGDMEITGKISALIYTGENSHNGFISKLFK